MILVDQVGYLPNKTKIAISTKPCNFQIIRISDQRSVYDGVASQKLHDSCAEEDVYQLDFSPVNQEGDYYILAGDKERSFPFTISKNIYHALQRDSLRCLYFQRCGIELTKEYAGKFAHRPCHTKEAILYDDFAKKIPDPTKYEVSGGWHDAGDFGRYTTAASVTVGHLLYAYELFPECFRESIHIPESGNGIPDILNEAYYELSWLLKMQFKDGGVSHKLTAMRHADFILPEDDHDQFYLFPVSSYATADFVAVMALASRIYRPFMPQFADKALEAAKLSTEWLKKNPFKDFKNPEGCNTGGYYDDADIDERLWAAAEMLRVDTDHRDSYQLIITELSFDFVSNTDFGWADVSGMACMSILTDPNHSVGMVEAKCKNDVLLTASKLEKLVSTSGYKVPMEPKDYVWGSNMVILNRAILFILASRLRSGDAKEKYENAALEQIHYLLGRNALNISFVTGFGANAFKNPHLRTTANIEGDPMPGWVSGGPFRFFCDPAAKAALKPKTAPMKCYVDDVGSYSTNEITIYWNSPLVFVTAFANSRS